MLSPQDARAIDVARAKQMLFATPEMRQALGRCAELASTDDADYWAALADLASICEGIFTTGDLDQIVADLPLHESQLAKRGAPLFAVGYGSEDSPRDSRKRARLLTGAVIERAVASICYQISGERAAVADARVAEEHHVEPGSVWDDRERVRSRLGQH